MKTTSEHENDAIRSVNPRLIQENETKHGNKAKD